VDSSVWIDYLRGLVTPQTDLLDRLLAAEPLTIGDLILAEVLQGCRDDRTFETVRKRLSALTVVELGGEAIAIQAAKNFRYLRERGCTARKTIDTIIATRCIEDGYELLHSDRDFDFFAQHLGLKTVG
jgi:predicted nucleic acid-binding protein